MEEGKITKQLSGSMGLSGFVGSYLLWLLLVCFCPGTIFLSLSDRIPASV